MADQAARSEFARGMLWVDEKGNPHSSYDSTASLKKREKLEKLVQMTKAEKEQAEAAVRAASQNLWKKVNPGCMADNTVTPSSTNQMYHDYRPELIIPTSWEHHFVKTDFAEFAEESAKQRVRELSAAGGGGGGGVHPVMRNVTS